MSNKLAPWKVAPATKSVGITVWRSDGDGKNYARICRNVRSEDDARLIAEAPALVDILLDFMELVEATEPEERSEEDLLLKDAYEIIKKIGAIRG